MTILPAAYLPSIEYCARWAQGPCVVDGGEHFVKRSERNRTHILTAGGVLALTVQAVRANRPRTPMRDVRIDYSKRWQHQHWTALVSAYKASPYFDHYAPAATNSSSTTTCASWRRSPNCSACPCRPSRKRI